MSKLTKAQIEKDLNKLEMPFSSSQVDYIYKALSRQKKEISLLIASYSPLSVEHTKYLIKKVKEI